MEKIIRGLKLLDFGFWSCRRPLPARLTAGWVQGGWPVEGELSALVQRGLGISFLSPGVNPNCPQHWEWPHEGETGLSQPPGAAPPPSGPQAWWQSPRPGDKVWEGGRASPQPLRLFPQGESRWLRLLPLSHLSSPTPMQGGGWQTGGGGSTGHAQPTAPHPCPHACRGCTVQAGGSPWGLWARQLVSRWGSGGRPTWPSH